MKVLVPTDFSNCAANAAEYAAGIAKKLNAEITLLHVAFTPPGTSHVSAFRLQHLEATISENAKQDCLQLLHHLKRKYKGLSISYQIFIDNDLIQVIENYATHNDMDLIIIGTKGASGLSKAIVGSHAAAVISNSNIPVIVVPPHVRFRGIKHIVYACDLSNMSEEVNLLTAFARLLNARIDIVHILAPDSRQKFNKAKLARDLVAANQYSKISIHFYLHQDIEDGLDQFFIQEKGDLLAMFTRDLTFFQKLFGKSSTRKMAFKSWVPLLTFKKNFERISS